MVAAGFCGECGRDVSVDEVYRLMIKGDEADAEFFREYTGREERLAPDDPDRPLSHTVCGNLLEEEYESET